MAMIGKVKRMHFREKKSVREIVRLTSLSRNTVRKWLKAPVLEEPRYRRREAPGKLTANDHVVLAHLEPAGHHVPGQLADLLFTLDINAAHYRGMHDTAVLDKDQALDIGRHAYYAWNGIDRLGHAIRVVNYPRPGNRHMRIKS